MIPKLTKVPGIKIALLAIPLWMVAGATFVRAQDTSAQPAQAQAPQKPEQSSGQETADEESSSRRRQKPREYKTWSFNIGGGGSLESGTADTYVKGGGAVAAAGVARNYSKYFGLRADFQWDNLPLRTSALQLAQAPGASSYMYSLMGGPVINIPVTKLWGGYVVVGPAYFHRTGKLDSSTVVPGTACNGFYLWWGTCSNGSLPLIKDFLSPIQNMFGFNFGFAVTRKITTNLELYGEYRFLRGTHNNITTSVRPITIGLRW